jgi:integrase/recombinase XerD
MPNTAGLHLPFDRWPLEDQQLWYNAIDDNDPFGDAAGARLSTATKKKYLFGWRRFLGFIEISDPAALDLPLTQRLTKERVKAFAQHLAETNISRSVAIQVEALYTAARIMLPESDLDWLKSMKARLHAAAPAQRPTGPVITSLQILQVGLSLMDENHPGEHVRIRLIQAIDYRDGLIIALLAFAPLRRKNIASLEIGRHLVGQGASRYIVIPTSETKTRVAIEFAVPPLLLPYLDSYLDVVRPRLLRNIACQAVWISPRGGALTYAAFGSVVSRHALRRLGMRLSTHDTRDAAATTWALADPGKIAMAADLLSHTDGRTMQTHYNRARGVEASRAYAAIVRSKRRSP